MIKQIEPPTVSAIEIPSRFQSLDGSTHASIEQASWRNAEFSLAFNVSVLFDLFRKSIATYVTAKTLNVDDLLEVIEGEKRAKWLGHTIKRMQDALEVLKGYRPEDMPEYVFGAPAQLPITYLPVDHAADVITEPKKRGRKPKAVDPNAVVVIKEPKKRGRKPKEIDPNAVVVIKEPKKRGRKPKVVDPNAVVVIKEPKKRGRKPKVVDPNAVVLITEPKKRGRKPKEIDPNAVVVVNEPKKRGRKPKVVDPNSVEEVAKRGYMVPVIAEAPVLTIAPPAKPQMVPPPLPRPPIPVAKVEVVENKSYAAIPPPPPRPPLPVKLVNTPTAPPPMMAPSRN